MKEEYIKIEPMFCPNCKVVMNHLPHTDEFVEGEGYVSKIEYVCRVCGATGEQIYNHDVKMVSMRYNAKLKN